VKIHRSLRIPAAVWNHKEGALVAAIPILVPAAKVHRHAGAKSTESFAELIFCVGWHARNANKAFIDKGLSLKHDRLCRRSLAGECQCHRRNGNEHKSRVRPSWGRDKELFEIHGEDTPEGGCAALLQRLALTAAHEAGRDVG